MRESSVTVAECQIERIVKRDFRGTNAAEFQTPAGYFLCRVWFEAGEPQFQFRTNAVKVGPHVNSLETASTIAIAIQMAIEWAVEEMEAMTA